MGNRIDYYWYYSSIKRRARRKNIQFSIEFADIIRLLEEQNYKCSISGVEIELSRIKPTKKNNAINTASLDRKDSSKGYTIDNVQWTHKIVNDMKWWYSESTFKEICTKVHEHNAGTALLH